MVYCALLDKAVYLKGAGSYAELGVFNDKTKFAVSMNVRPATKDEMIVYGEDALSSDFISLGIKNGFVEVRYELSFTFCLVFLVVGCLTGILVFSLDAGQGKVTVKSKQPVATSEWHNITVTRDRLAIKLTVDKQGTVQGTLPKTFTEIVLDRALVFGEPKQPVKRYVVYGYYFNVGKKSNNSGRTRSGGLA